MGKDYIKIVDNREVLHYCSPIISAYKNINSNDDIYELISWLAEAFGNSAIPCEFLCFIIPELKKILEEKKIIFSKFIDLISKSFENDKRHFNSLMITYAEIEPEKALRILDEHIANKLLQ